MFTPHSFYIKKKSNAPDFDAAAADEAWSKLSDSKLTKFVRKAEKAYDAHVASLDEDDLKSIEPFSKSLTPRELELLLKHYGLPSKLPVNTRFFYFNKINQNAVNPDDENEHSSQQYKQLEEKWKNLSEREKAECAREYREAEIEYNKSFFQFAKTLPEARIVDYEAFLDVPVVKKSRAPRKSIGRMTDIAEALKEIAAEAESSNGEKRERVSKKADKSKNPELKLREFIPFEVYYEKKRDDFAHLGSPFTAKTKAHSSYSQLSDRKKLKYIKEAETRYDAYEFISNPKPLFAEYLSKSELRLLLKSYQMPEKVLNPSAQFMKEHMKDAGGSAPDRMKFVAAKYKNLDEKAKTAFLNRIAEETKKFEENKKVFLKNLPEPRQKDYEFLLKRKPNVKRLKREAKTSVKGKKKSSKSSNKSHDADKSAKIEPGQQRLVVVDIESPVKSSGSSATPTKRKALVVDSNSAKHLKVKLQKS